jgi:putative transposase
MPDHVHALIWLPEIGRLSGFMLGWKRVSSYRIGEWYRRYGSEYAEALKEDPRVWQPRYYAFAIRSEDKLREKLDYMHRNPVAAALATEPGDWRWSSARWYERRRSVGVTIEWIA